MQKLRLGLGLKRTDSGGSVTPPALFTPLDTPALFMYHNSGDLSSITNVSDKASLYDDLSGNGHDFVQGNSAFRLSTEVEDWGGKNVLSHAALDGRQYMDADVSGLSDTHTFMCVCSSIAGNDGNSGAFQMFNSNLYRVRSSTGGTAHHLQFTGLGCNTISFGGLTPGDHYILAFEADAIAGTFKYYANGTHIGTDTNYTGNLSAATLRIMAAEAFNYITGEYAGDVAYQGTSEDSRQRNEGFWAHELGMLGDLPGDHPYKTDPPLQAAVVPDAIFLTEPADDDVFQRSTNNTTGPVPIIGTYTGTAPSAIEARILDSGSSVLVDWTSIDASPSGGTFFGILTAPVGNDYTMEVRRAENTSLVSVGNNIFSIGICGGIYGQSNSENLSSGYAGKTGENALKAQILALTGLKSKFVNGSKDGS